MDPNYQYDVAIVGGGPGGSTCASILLKYRPETRVLVIERETFPRDHVGESQLPPISKILDEMGCWDKVEAAGFPIKLGATYKWGRTKELWDFEFFPSKDFVDEPRPAEFQGCRQMTAFQVDRSQYDKILLDHAKELGAEVRQPAKVVSVERDGDAIKSLALESGESITARWYVDATGHTGMIRRAMGVETDVATSLQNIAIWDYWQNAEWAVDIGVGGTRVQVMSLGYGWLWFIPLGTTRTSIGLVLPVETFKKMGRPPSDIYYEAVSTEPHIAALTKNAVSESRLATTKDWSFIAKRIWGDNWFLVGESAGFADPILAAGLTLTQIGAKELAVTLIELMRGLFEAKWLKDEYAKRQEIRLISHIRFADYWYTANSQFTQLKEFTAEIAKDNGLDLTPDKAWAWLAQGGFLDYDANLGIAGFTVKELVGLGEFLTEVKPTSVLKNCNRFKLNLEGADYEARAVYLGGGIKQGGSYVRGDKVLPMTSSIAMAVKLLSRVSTSSEIVAAVSELIRLRSDGTHLVDMVIGRLPHAFEAMAADGWIDCSFEPDLPLVDLPLEFAQVLKWNTDNKEVLAESIG